MCTETVEKIIILVHAVWELVKVGTCYSEIDLKYDVAPLPSLIFRNIAKHIELEVIYVFQDHQNFFLMLLQ